MKDNERLAKAIQKIPEVTSSEIEKIGLGSTVTVANHSILKHYEGQPKQIATITGVTLHLDKQEKVYILDRSLYGYDSWEEKFLAKIEGV